jgi:putative ABC transport system ATP-binding protein
MNIPLKNLPLEARQLAKQVAGPDGTLTILREVNLHIRAGEAIAILGASGTGKSTLLGLLAGLDLPSGGRVRLFGEDLSRLDEDGRAALRAGQVGFVFQSFQLLPALTALENVMLPLELNGRAGDRLAALAAVHPRERPASSRPEMAEIRRAEVWKSRLPWIARTRLATATNLMDDVRQRALDSLSRVGLADRVRHYPHQLSGGEQQRVAIARAFAPRPRILFADEPTGNLDQATGRKVIELMFSLRDEHGAALVLVTHDAELTTWCDRRYRLREGCLEPVADEV